jgi:hypothetical protein
MVQASKEDQIVGGRGKLSKITRKNKDNLTLKHTFLALKLNLVYGKV